MQQGYNEQEILTKTLSLKGVLEPFSSNANLEMIKRAGFQDIVLIFKRLCFEGYLAIK
jgi:tRNA (cmo5U34)-methyltransferase